MKLKLLMILVTISTISYSQQIHFDYTNGTKSSYKVEDIRKITFTGDVMNLHLLDGSDYSWNVSTIGHYKYNEATTNTQEIINLANSWELSLYPNPTSSVLNLSFNLPQSEVIVVSVYDLNGKLLQETNFGQKQPGKNEVSVDLVGLSTGTYVLKIQGNQNAITKKIIKK